MEQKIYIVTETWCQQGEDTNSQIIGVFSNREAARKCLAEAKAQNEREWPEIYEDIELWEVEDTPDHHDAVQLGGFGEFYELRVDETPLQDTYTGWQELTEQMDEKQREAFNSFTNQFSAGVVCDRAERDGEKPMGFILTYLRDQGLPKTQGWIVAEAILKYLRIDNEKRQYRDGVNTL